MSSPTIIVPCLRNPKNAQPPVDGKYDDDESLEKKYLHLQKKFQSLSQKIKPRVIDILAVCFVD